VRLGFPGEIPDSVFAARPLVHWISPIGTKSDIFIKPIIQQT